MFQLFSGVYSQIKLPKNDIQAKRKLINWYVSSVCLFHGNWCLYLKREKLICVNFSLS